MNLLLILSAKLIISFILPVVSILCGRHTSIIVHKDEFYYGAGGISSCAPVS